MRTRLCVTLATGIALACAALPGAAKETDAGKWLPDSVSSIQYPVKNAHISSWQKNKGITKAELPDEALDDPILRGAIDVHAHYGPDVYDRQWDAFEIAKRAQAHGMRAIVLKSHFTESSTIAAMTQKYATPGMQVFGGIALNVAVGGINPDAVRHFAEVSGDRARVVWFPTHDSVHEIDELGQSRPAVRVTARGTLIPQVYAVLDIIAEKNLTLATGHVTADEMLQIVKAAQARKITRIIVTHPGLGPQYTNPSLDQARQAVAMGAYLEVVTNELLRDRSRAGVLAMIRSVGPAHVIVASDSGLRGTRTHTDALVTSARLLRKEGFSEQDLDLMFRTNPARALGLPPLGS